MSGSFDEAFLGEVRERNDIVSVIGDYVTLRKAGTSFKGLCPFHGEKTPSFHVHPDKRFFYCFGCQTGGDVITFVREINGYSFPEAVRHLAERVGMTVPERPAHGGYEARPPKAGTASREARDSTYAINRIAQAFYADALEAMEGSRCREYLTQRGVERATAQRFGLGYAPDRWDGLVSALQRDSGDLKAAEAVGLIVRRANGPGFYDRFRNRLMFPIRSLAGEVIGFSGRALPGESQTEKGQDGGAPAKYVNSPESPVYQKGDNLYGLHDARAAIRKASRALLVEGNLDLVSLSQSGLEEVVAPLGTALTATQCRLLKRFVPRVVALYDGDGAGRAAASKAAALALAEGLAIEIATLPDGEDPDSYVKQHGKAGLDRVLEKAIPGWDYLLDRAFAETRAFENVQGAKAAIERLAPVLADIQDGDSRTLYEKRLAEMLRMDPAEVAQLARAVVRKQPQPRPEPVVGRPAPEAPIREVELRLVELLVHYPLARALYLGRDAGALVQSPLARRVCDAIAELEGDAVEALAALPMGELRDRVLRRMKATRIDEPKSYFEGLMNDLRQDEVERKLQGIRADDRRAYLGRDEDTVIQDAFEKIRLQRQLESLRKRG